MTTPRSSDTTQWLTADEQAAWRGLLRLHAKLSAELHLDLAGHSDLSLTDYGVLAVLTERPDARMRAFELVEELGWEKSRLSHHVARMARRGLVTRERCPSDARGLYVAATARGKAALVAAAPGHVATVRRAFVDPLSPAQLAAMADVAGTILRRLDPPGETGEPVTPTA